MDGQYPTIILRPDFWVNSRLSIILRRHLKVTDEHSFFLFGARGTGKSTFLRHHFAGQDVLWVDLLLPQEEDRFALRPELLAEQISARPAGASWVVIDAEIKSAERVDATDLRHLSSLARNIPNSEALCLSQEPVPRVAHGIRIVPWRQGLDEIGLAMPPL